MKKAIVGVLAAAAILILVFLSIQESPSDPGVSNSGEQVVVSGTSSGDSTGDGSATPGATANGEADPDSPKDSGLGGGGTDLEAADVKHTVEGRVTDRGGVPLEGALVQFVVTVEAAEQGPPSAQVTTDADGNFRLALTQDEPGLIRASADRFDEKEEAWAPSAEGEEVELVVLRLHPETSFSGRVTLPEGFDPTDGIFITAQRYRDAYSYSTPVTRDFTEEDGSYYFGDIKPGKFRVWAYSPGTYRSAVQRIEVAKREHLSDVSFQLDVGCTLRARAYEKQSGRPVVGAVVYVPKSHVVGSVNPFTRSEFDEKYRNVGRTGSDGVVEISDLPAGSFMVRFLHPDFKPAEATVALTKDTVTEVEVAMDEGTGIRGEVLDELGEPMEGVTMIAVTMGGTFDPEISLVSGATVDVDGEYYIKNLTPGPYIVIRNPLPEVGADQQRMEFTSVKAGADTVVDFIEISELATVRGKVTRVNGDPVPGAHLNFMGQDEAGEVMFKTVTANDEGEYEAQNLRLGPYSVGVGLRPGGIFSVTSAIDCKESIDYELDLVLQELIVNGVVRSSKGPISSVEIFVLRADALAAGDDENAFAGRTVTDDGGAYELPGLGTGKYLLQARAPGFAPSEANFELHEKTKKQAEVNLRLEPGGTVEVYVVDQQGQPVDAALVRIQDESGETVNEGLPPRTSEGRYRFASLQPGQHTVVVVAPENEPITRVFDAQAGQTTNLRIQLP